MSAECVTPELVRLGEFVISDCAGTFPTFGPVAVLAAGVIVTVYLLRAVYALGRRR